MNGQWHNTTVVLTGAYGGLGQALAQALDGLGARLILVGRDAERLNQLSGSLQHPAQCVAGDVTDPDLLQKVTQLLSQTGGNHRLLINNAACSRVGFLPQLTPAELQQMMAVNLLAPMTWTQALLPWLQQAEQGQVINVGSSFGGIGYPGFSGYCASKFGLRGFTQAINREWAGSRVTASYVAPRAMSTGINSAAVNELNEQLGNRVDEPSKIAAQIIQTIEQRAQERFFGWPEKWFVKLNALFPKMVGQAINKDQPKIKSILNNQLNNEINSEVKS